MADLVQLVECKANYKEVHTMYKVGDVVKVRKDLIHGERYGSCVWLDIMMKLKVTLKEKHEEGWGVEGCGFTYTEEMFVNEPKQNTLSTMIDKYGDIEVDEQSFKDLLGIKDDKVWLPKKGDNYWYVSDLGVIIEIKHDGELSERRIEHQRVFETKEEAVALKENQAFSIKMERDFINNSDKIDWNDTSQYKFWIYYDCTDGYLDIEADNYTRNEGTLYTTSQKWLEQYIKDNEQSIKKLIGVQHA